MIVARDGHYGVDALLRHVLDTARRRADQESCCELFGRRLRAEREAFDLTLREFAPHRCSARRRRDSPRTRTARLLRRWGLLGRLERATRALTARREVSLQ